MQSLSIETLAVDFAGELYLPSDEAYESLRQPWRRNIDSHPAIIVEPMHVADVQRAVQFAVANDLPIAVQSSGHGAVATTDDAMLIRTTRMNGITVDAAAKTVTLEPGVLWADVVTETDQYDLAPITGDSPWVGVMGFTLGGGQGWLSRQYGLAATSIVSATVVTADGTLIVVDETQHSDLLWALRGGSGNFGVVVSLTITLHAVGEVFAGAVYFDAAHAEPVLRAYRDWLPALPSQYTPFLMAAQMPPVPQLPESIRGRKIVLIQSFYNGDAATGRSLLDAFLHEVGIAPLADFAGTSRYAAFMSEAPRIPGSVSAEAVGLQAEISDEQIKVLASYMRGEQALHPMIQIRPWGGVLAHSEEKALLHYDTVRFSIATILPLGRLSATEQEPILAQFSTLQKNIAEHASEQVFINFISDTTKTAHAFTTEAYDRLTHIKKQYDPQNRFCRNHNITPAA